MAAETEEIIALLKKAYSMELETVTNYLANSINLDGVRAEEIKKALAADVTEEIGHAQVRAARMKQIGLNPVGTLLAIERRAAQLARISAALGNRRYQDLDKGEKARLGIFWKEERDIAEQVQRWRGPKPDRLTRRLPELHRELLTNSQASELLLAQGLTGIARVAGAGRR